jgi:hypothetical protein
MKDLITELRISLAAAITLELLDLRPGIISCASRRQAL